MSENEIVRIDDWEPDEYIPSIKNDTEKKEILSRVKSLFSTVAFSYIQICDDLYHIRKEKYYHVLGYSSFKKYVESDLHIDLRQAQYYISTYKKLVFEHKISKEYVQRIGITKARALVSVITEDNKEEMVNEALNCTVSEFHKKYRPKVISEESFFTSDIEPKKKKRERKPKLIDVKEEDYAEIIRDYNFRLYDDQTYVVDNAIEVAKESTGSDSDAFALSIICSSFLATTIIDKDSGNNIVPLEMIKGIVEKAYSVKLSVD